MDFVQGNWFSILTVISIVVGFLWQRAKRDGKMDEMMSKVDGFETKLDSKVDNAVKDVTHEIDKLSTSFNAHERKFNDHVANSDIHVTDMLLDLLKERHDYSKNEFANTRTDIQRVETMLSSMMK